MKINTWFDKDTYTLTYCVYDDVSRDAIIIDPVWDYDPAGGGLTSTSVNLVTDFVRAHSLVPRLILETHAHADHITGAQPLKKQFSSAKVGVGAKITEVQKVFKKVFNLGDHFALDGRQFDHLLADGSEITAGSLRVKTIATPGHTPACVSYLIGDALFTGDTLFMPDYGTGRCDFPAGSAADLYDSVQKIYALPGTTRVFTGHDYQPGGREVRWESTIAEEMRDNIHINSKTTKSDYITMREARDKTLKAPRLLLPSIQVNIDGGSLPSAENNGTCYLKMPVKIK